MSHLRARIQIGNGIGGGAVNQPLYVDASGNLAQDADWVYNPTNNAMDIGPARLGDWPGFGGYAMFGNKTALTASVNNYALLQTPAGATALNAASGQTLSFRTLNIDRFLISDGYCAFNASLNSAVAFWVEPSSSAQFGMLIQGKASQAQPLLELRTSAANTLAKFDQNGVLTLVSLGTSTTTPITLSAPGGYASGAQRRIDFDTSCRIASQYSVGDGNDGMWLRFYSGSDFTNPALSLRQDKTAVFGGGLILSNGLTVSHTSAPVLTVSDLRSTYSDAVILRLQMNSAWTVGDEQWMEFYHPSGGAMARIGSYYEFPSYNDQGLLFYTSNGGMNSSPSLRLHGNHEADFIGRVKVQLATEQLRLAYDGSNYLSVIVASNGGAIFDSVGSNPRITFNDAITVNTLSQITLGDYLGTGQQTYMSIEDSFSAGRVVINSTGVIELGDFEGDGNSISFLIHDAAAKFQFSQGDILLADGFGFQFGTTTGSKIGLASNQKLAFYGVTPVTQRTAATPQADPCGSMAGSDTVDKGLIQAEFTSHAQAINSIIQTLADLGLAV